MDRQGNIRTFFKPFKGSGRIAPTLQEDLSLFDPYETQECKNLLDTPPINNGSVQFLHQVLPPASCRHALYLQPRQTKKPAIDERPGPKSKYQVAALCRKCRVHLTVTVDYSIRWKSTPCPNEDRPVHHLIYSEENSELARATFKNKNPEARSQIYAYGCSSATCSALVTVTLEPAVLTDELVRLLTDRDLLRERTNEAFEVHKATAEGMKHPSPVDVLTELRGYIGSSWEGEMRPDIPLDNKRFALRFGPQGRACQDLLQSLLFVREDNAWITPKPIGGETGIDEPLRHNHNKFLDNLEYELSALALSQPEEDRRAAQYTGRLEDARIELARALGCLNYDRAPMSRTTRILPENRPPPFIVLGTPEDADDTLVQSAYDWQCSTDPENAPTYLSALRDVSTERGSEALQVRIAIEESSGKVDLQQMTFAFESLGLPWNTPSDQNYIIGTFNARLQDSPAQEAQLRKQLRIIGTGLRNRRIIDYASREITTYEQALDFLNASTESDDVFVQTLFSLKTTESPSQTDLAEKAVQVIARYRKSEALNAFITEGFTTGVATAKEMDLGEAYTVLGIDDRTTDDVIILEVYKIRKQDDYGNADRCTRALTVIAQDRQSPILLKELNMSTATETPATLTEPVGLDNIGNTCYLNSLLQFLFTVKPVRNIVLEFDKFKMDPSPELMEAKKVGQRKISLKEVEIGQKFAQKLAGLFEQMITSPVPAVRPEQELARLTLETDSVKDKIRRRSTIGSANRPSLGMIENRPIQGPLPKQYQQTNNVEAASKLDIPLATVVDDDDDDSTKAVGSSPVDLSTLLFGDTNDDNSSEATLVSRPGSGDRLIAGATPAQQQSIFDNKENLAPQKSLDQKETALESGEPLRPASPSKINAQAGALANKAQSEQVAPSEQQPLYKPPPGPPPVPPRKPIQTTTSTLEEYARQQDVTEVISHCLYQLSSAMRPTGTEASGEQRDEVHDLFFGELQRHMMPEQEKPEGITFLNVQASVHNQPKDIYAALDSWFDLAESDTGRKEYVSITRLPPVFTIALGRVIWDSISKSQKKLDHHVELLEEIYMDRYLEAPPESELIRKRQETWALKQNLSQLEEQKAFYEQPHAGAKDVATLFEDAKEAVRFLRDQVDPDEKFGGPITIDPAIQSLLGGYSKEVRRRVESINTQVKGLNQNLASIFSDRREHPYMLHAAFFHRGSYGSGHYWVYIKDHVAGIWRKYNDDHVTVVKDVTEIFGRPDTTGGWSGPATPYVLVYIKKGTEPDALDNIIQTVRRDPLPIPEEETGQDLDLATDNLAPFGSEIDWIKAPSKMTVSQAPTVRFDLDDLGEKSSVREKEQQRDAAAVTTSTDDRWDNSELAVENPQKWYS